MARRSQQTDPEQLRTRLVELLVDFEEKLSADNLRAQVQELIPAHYLLRDLGSSLVPIDITSARDRILFYLKKYPQTMISGEELMVVAGIGEWARRVRELRVQLGWRIITGVTVAEMAAVEDCEKDDRVLEQMAPDDYMLLDTEPDRDAAYRWNVANDLRKNTELGIRDKILAYLRENVGKQVTGDELRYVAGDKTEWARRVRELRTEYGWAVVTKQTGMPELPIGTYMLELDRQSPPHDRTIPDSIRREVLKRDGLNFPYIIGHSN